jgi:hypothetical protein
VAPQQKAGSRQDNHYLNHSNNRAHSPNETLLPKAVQEFLNASSSPSAIAGEFSDILDTRRTARWTQLQRALEACKQKNATLLILELGTLASHESFTQTLLASNVTFHCLDQPFVNQTILEALSKHAEVQRKLHGKLIREGLRLTSAKSGNPNAAQVIGKVNKPKIDTAIVFASLLQPIIQDYRRKGYSQRQMVKALNEEGFSAPEGGKWVLSQLQKVLDRVRLNEFATELQPILEDYEAQSLTPAAIAEALGSKGVLALKQPGWDESQVKKLQDRIQQIKDIIFMNRFALDLLPLLHEYRHRGLSPAEILTESHVQSLLQKLKQELQSFKGNEGYLEYVFESTAKHIPVYLKIVKGHIEQLAKVLELETHNRRDIESVNLAEPVMQLMQLFRALTSEDIELLEALAIESRYATPLPTDSTVRHTVQDEVSTIS